MHLMTTRIRNIAFWLLPLFFCLAVYWYGLKAWFSGDDFLWLGLLHRVYDWNSLWDALFTPTRHGTFRPLSERAFFLVFRALFDLDNVPYRIWVFLTQFGSLALMASIVWRITGSRLAGFLAPVLWTANSNIAHVMAWDSAYMQILCGFCLLLAFHFFLRYMETGRRRFYWLQWAVFLTGFLVMETNVMYPVLAASYTALCARKHFRSTLPLFGASALYAALHMALIPKAAAGPYAMHLDDSILTTFAAYWRLVWAPFRLTWLTGLPAWLGTASLVAATLGLIVFIAWQIRRRNWLPLFFLSWYVVLLAPLLPLRDHIIPYGLTLPVSGIAMFGAYAVALSWRAPRPAKAAAAFALALYLFVSTPTAFAGARWWTARSKALKPLVLGVQRAAELHPNKVILLTGVTDDMFWGAVADNAFKAVGAPNTYLAPETEAAISPHPELADVKQFIVPAPVIAQAIDNRSLVVYSAGGPRLKNVTQTYTTLFVRGGHDGLPRRLDVGPSLANPFLGPGWSPSEATFRWMGKAASLRLAAPQSTPAKLYVKGFAPAFLFANGPVTMTLRANGRPLPPQRIANAATHFELELPLPAGLENQPALEVAIELDRVTRPAGEDRDLGLIFGVFEVR
jgi:hypothetical protein